jgi:hypothetical protein
MTKKISEAEAKKIAKVAKKRNYKGNLEAMALYQILTNIGGEFGMIMRHVVEEYNDIEHGSEEESFAFLNWLPNHMVEWLVNSAKNDLVKASFVTNINCQWHNHWHIVADSAKKVVIETKIRRWCKTPEAKKFIKRNEHRNDCITTYHWL